MSDSSIVHYKYQRKQKFVSPIANQGNQAIKGIRSPSNKSYKKSGF